MVPALIIVPLTVVVLLVVSYVELEPTDSVPKIRDVLLPPENARVSAFVGLLRLSVAEEEISKQLLPPLRVNAPAPELCKVIFVVPLTVIELSVNGAGTPVIVAVVPLLKATMSPDAGGSRPATPSHPDQFPDIVQLEFTNPVHVQMGTGVGLIARELRLAKTLR